MGFSPAVGRFLERDPIDAIASGANQGVRMAPVIQEAIDIATDASLDGDFDLSQRTHATLSYSRGMNLYLYASGNPLINTDPSGLMTRAAADELRKMRGKAAMWNLVSPGWMPSNQCGQQAFNLMVELNRDKWKHWNVTIVGGQAWWGYHHHVVLLTPIGHIAPDYVLDAYKGPLFPWGLPELRPYADFKSDYPYPGDVPHCCNKE